MPVRTVIRNDRIRPRHPGRQAAPAGPRTLHGRALHDDPRRLRRGRPRRRSSTPAAVYPKAITIDPEEMAADEETYYTVTLSRLG